MDSSMKCPACLEALSCPIYQCRKGHSACGRCVSGKKVGKCPTCNSGMTKKRNYQLEALLSKLKDVKLTAACSYALRGCKYELALEEKQSHEKECKNRMYTCEGKLFKNWNCEWSGGCGDILAHFKSAHPLSCLMEFKAEFTMRCQFTKTSTDLQAINFYSGQHLFWYKHKTDVEKEKAYWVFQYVGTKNQAAQYYYEFEIFDDTVRKIKVTEICENDTEDANLIFNSEKCVVLPFNTVKNYLDKDELISIRFRIMRIKK